uniref:Uncharacterized protein n=1 Tax=Cucumis melo TaxID=3656 RepID=A0A9I9EA74_CUCME
MAFMYEFPPISSKTSITSTTMGSSGRQRRTPHTQNLHSIGRRTSFEPHNRDHCQPPITEWSKWGFSEVKRLYGGNGDFYMFLSTSSPRVEDEIPSDEANVVVVSPPLRYLFNRSKSSAASSIVGLVIHLSKLSVENNPPLFLLCRSNDSSPTYHAEAVNVSFHGSCRTKSVFCMKNRRNLIDALIMHLCGDMADRDGDGEAFVNSAITHLTLLIFYICLRIVPGAIYPIDPDNMFAVDFPMFSTVALLPIPGVINFEIPKSETRAVMYAIPSAISLHIFTLSIRFKSEEPEVELVGECGYRWLSKLPFAIYGRTIALKSGRLQAVIILIRFLWRIRFKTSHSLLKLFVEFPDCLPEPISLCSSKPPVASDSCLLVILGKLCINSGIFDLLDDSLFRAEIIAFRRRQAIPQHIVVKKDDMHMIKMNIVKNTGIVPQRSGLFKNDRSVDDLKNPSLGIIPWKLLNERFRIQGSQVRPGNLEDDLGGNYSKNLSISAQCNLISEGRCFQSNNPRCGNSPNSSGMLEVKRLCDKKSCSNFDNLLISAGIVPLSRFDVKFSPASFESLAKLGGIDPNIWKLSAGRFSTSTAERGSSPLNWLLYRLRFHSFGQFPISSGILPVRKLLDRSTFSKDVQLEKREGGTVPFSLFSIRLITNSKTREIGEEGWNLSHKSDINQTELRYPMTVSVTSNASEVAYINSLNPVS